MFYRLNDVSDRELYGETEVAILGPLDPKDAEDVLRRQFLQNRDLHVLAFSSALPASEAHGEWVYDVIRVVITVVFQRKQLPVPIAEDEEEDDDGQGYST